MKRFISSMLIFLLIIGMVPNVGGAANDYEPVITIENTKIPLVNPDSDTSITLYIKNSGGAAQNVIMTPIFDWEGPFKANGLTTSISVPNISSSRTAIKLDLSVLSDAKGGTYPIKLKFDYKYIKSYNETSTERDYRTPERDYGNPEWGYSTPEWGYGSQELVIYVKVNDKTTQPRLIITEVSTDPKVIVPGQNLKLNVFFENKGSLEAKDIKTKLVGLKNDGGFTLSAGSDIGYIKSVRGKSVSFVTYELKAANNIKRGSHELDLNFNYAGMDEPQKIYLNVGGDGGNQSSSLIMENMKYPTGSIGQNKEVDVSFDLRNQGQMKARNILIKAESTDQTGLVAKSVSTIKLLAIEAGATETLNFKFITTRSSETKNYPINITVEYVDDLSAEAENYSLNQFVGIFVEAPAEKDPADEIKSTPRLIIDKYNFTPALVPAGENFSMNLSFFNTNSEKTVKNIKIFLTSDEKTDPNSNSGGGSVFTPVDSSNTFYIDSIPPKGRVEKTITMFTVPDAQAKTYTLTANFEYEDNKGEAYTATELIGVPVIQQSKLETGELSVFPEAYVGTPAPVSIEFFNTGKVTLYNMMVKLEGDFQTESGSYYIGNFASGSSEFFEGMVIPGEPGELIGDLVFSYEDSTGQEQEIRKPFTLNVMDAPPMPEFPGEEFPPVDEGGGFTKLLKSPIVWGILVLIGGIIGFIVYRKKKKEKEFALDE